MRNTERFFWGAVTAGIAAFLAASPVELDSQPNAPVKVGCAATDSSIHLRNPV